jgi:chromate transporter
MPSSSPVSAADAGPSHPTGRGTLDPEPKTPTPPPPGGPERDVPFREALRVWVRVALLSFGGPAGQIAVMHRILVEEKRYIDEGRFLHALNYCMLLPGPEAQQLATYIGWLLHRTWGGIVAGVLFVLPGFASILALSILYALFRDAPVVAGIFYGIKPVVVAIVVEALLRIGRRALTNRLLVSLAAASFVAIFFFDVRFPLIVLGAALVGFLGQRLGGERLFPGPAGGAEPPPPPAATGSGWGVAGNVLRVVAVWGTLWLAPIALLAAVRGGDDVFVQLATFFSKVAVVTFGGAYAVLAYVAQEAVQTHGWLRPGEMLDGLGMAETTPGPLVQVVQFVGFMGAFRHPEGLDPLTAGILASVVVTWVTFVPCFLFVFAGAPLIESLRSRRALGAALSAITAAVVGVILNLAVWFSLHTLFATVATVRSGPLRLFVPAWETVDPFGVALAVGAFLALFRFRLGMLTTLAGGALLGLAYFLAVMA